ncbi:hypothetical protein DFP72DRAFT_634607 [Ephemerocybe angulata]|uniref:DUF6533 domain-containing protein n=1 Tax=Ephemerocybe angulata TaxID=980116 RepID=A0A8H6HGI5_9AGAR|nr:hypothetical protein DFP72DRAFT_634607 [Tulosesus angulatus]
MSLSPEQLAKLTASFTYSQQLELFAFGIYTAYVYHYLTTLAEEVTAIWPQKWRAGKILFLVTRYTLIIFTAISILVGNRVGVVLPPKSCEFLYIGLYGPILSMQYL